MAEPILWANKATRTRMLPNGKTERIPQMGHEGGSDYDKPTTLRNERWARVVDHHGHDLRVVLTNAASHTDVTTEYANYQRAKFAFLGWFPIGECPLARLISGQMRRAHFADPSMIGQPPCPPRSHTADDPCPHAVRERDARRARNLVVETERQVKMQPEADKLLAAQREQTNAILDAQREQTAALAGAFTGAIQQIASAIRPPEPPAPPNSPPPAAPPAEPPPEKGKAK